MRGAGAVQWERGGGDGRGNLGVAAQVQEVVWEGWLGA